MQETVKFYNTSKGYGFIIGNDGADYYFHVSDVNETISEGITNGVSVVSTSLETKR